MTGSKKPWKLVAGQLVPTPPTYFGSACPAGSILSSGFFSILRGANLLCLPRGDDVLVGRYDSTYQAYVPMQSCCKRRGAMSQPNECAVYETIRPEPPLLPDGGGRHKVPGF